MAHISRLLLNYARARDRVSLRQKSPALLRRSAVSSVRLTVPVNPGGPTPWSRPKKDHGIIEKAIPPVPLCAYWEERRRRRKKLMVGKWRVGTVRLARNFQILLRSGGLSLIFKNAANLTSGHEELTKKYDHNF